MKKIALVLLTLLASFAMEAAPAEVRLKKVTVFTMEKMMTVVLQYTKPLDSESVTASAYEIPGKKILDIFVTNDTNAALPVGRMDMSMARKDGRFVVITAVDEDFEMPRFPGPGAHWSPSETGNPQGEPASGTEQGTKVPSEAGPDGTAPGATGPEGTDVGATAPGGLGSDGTGSEGTDVGATVPGGPGSDETVRGATAPGGMPGGMPDGMGPGRMGSGGVPSGMPGGMGPGGMPGGMGPGGPAGMMSMIADMLWMEVENTDASVRQTSEVRAKSGVSVAAWETARTADETYRFDMETVKSMMQQMRRQGGPGAMPGPMGGM